MIDLHLKLGKLKVQNRIHYLSAICKEKLSNIPNIILLTPMEQEISSGFICAKITGLTASEIVSRLLSHNIIVGQTPYEDTSFRISPSIYNTEEEIITACNIITEIASEARQVNIT